MKCPRCQAELAAKTYELLDVERCNQCDGIWLDVGKLPRILSAHDKSFPPALIEKTLKEAHAGIPAAELSASLPCPRCSKTMNAMNYDYSSGVVINACPNGEGLWFDKDELARVQIFMEHWDGEERKNQAKWAGMAQQARQAEQAELARQDSAVRQRLSPIDQTLDAVLSRFKKLGRKD